MRTVVIMEHHRGGCVALTAGVQDDRRIPLHGPAAVERPVPPEPISIAPLPTGWVDLKLHQQSHPVWQP